MSNDDKAIFEFSQQKLQFIKHLVSPEAFNLIRTGLKFFSTLVNESAHDGLMLGFKGQDYLKESYFNYLSGYANNLLTYTPPVRVDPGLDRGIFEKLFKKFVY
ncbi:MAG: hypothetical protein K9G42_12030 [Pedobacter sp.]|nr:hypothetical protein [Pedobacter sp.]